jgi:hypothetical protein
MSNKASDSLHKLIKSMTKPEKRYFKVFSSRHVIGDQNNYQILFDAIDKLDNYDESKLLKKFSGEAFVNRFSIAKSRLYNSILKSLNSFHSNSSVDAQLKRNIHCAEILYNKSLYDQSSKLLNSAKKTAIKHEKITTLIEISKWEKRIIEKDQYEGIGASDVDAILKADSALTQKIAIHNNLWNVKSQIFQNLYARGKVRSEADLADLKRIIDQVVPANTESKMTAENGYLLNHIYSAYYYGTGNFEACYPYLENNIKLIEAKPHLFADEPNVYLSVITNAIYVASRLQKESDALKLIKKLEKPPKIFEAHLTEDLELRQFAISMSTQLTLHIQSGKYEAGVLLIPQIEEGLVKYEDKLTSIRKASFYFNIAVLLFNLKRYNESLKWTNQLLNYIDIDTTTDLHCMTQILNLIVHLELDNKSLLPYTLRSTQRYLQTRNKVYQFESIFLSFVNEILKKRQNTSANDLYTSLAIDLEAIQDDMYERHALEYFDFIGWARSKAEAVIAQD